MRGAVAWGFVAWWGAACTDAQGEVAPAPEIADRVTFAAPAAADEVVVATLPAAVVPAPGGAHAIGPGVTGRLARWHVAPGDVVAAGAPLAELVSAELSALAAEAARDAVAAEGARRVLDVRARALAGGVASADVAAEASWNAEAAEASATARRAALAALRDTSTPSGAGWTWRSPVDGVVSELRCALGTVAADDVCLGLVVPDAVAVEVGLPERYLDLARGPLTGTFTAADGRQWALSELSRAPSVSTTLRALPVRFGVAGAAPLVGVSGRAAVRVAAQAGDVVVPRDSVTRLDGHDVVFVAGDAPATARQVQVVGRHDGGVVVRGLAPGEAVAVRGTFLLKSLLLLGDEEGE